MIENKITRKKETKNNNQAKHRDMNRHYTPRLEAVNSVRAWR